MKQIRCNHNHIKKFVTASLNEWEELELVDISGNAFTSLEQELTAFVKVKTLISNHNYITSVNDSINAMKCLTHLDLSDNKLSSLPDALGECTTLEKLELQRNDFKEFPSCIPSLTTLNYLSLDHCRLCEDAQEEYFSLLTELKHLDLSHNKIVNLSLSIYSSI